MSNGEFESALLFFVVDFFFFVDDVLLDSRGLRVAESAEFLFLYFCLYDLYVREYYIARHVVVVVVVVVVAVVLILVVTITLIIITRFNSNFSCI